MKKVRFYYDMIVVTVKEIFSRKSVGYGDTAFRNLPLVSFIIVTEIMSLISWFIVVIMEGEPFVFIILAMPIVISFCLLVVMSILAVTFNTKDIKKDIKKRISGK